MTIPLNNEQITVAARARTEFGFGPLEPVDILKVVELDKMACVFRPLDSQVSGIFVRVGSARVVLVNSAKSLGPQRFTLAHELYHAHYDTDLSFQTCHAGTKNSGRERAADEFAAHFLIPVQGLWNYLTPRLFPGHEIDLPDVLFLEQLFGVSHQAMLIQLKRFSMVNHRQIIDWESVSIRRVAREWGYDDALYRPTHSERIITDYVEKSKRALDQDLISFAKYEELLADAGLLEQVMGGAGGEDDDLVD